MKVVSGGGGRGAELEGDDAAAVAAARKLELGAAADPLEGVEEAGEGSPLKLVFRRKGLFEPKPAESAAGMVELGKGVAGEEEMTDFLFRRVDREN